MLILRDALAGLTRFDEFEKSLSIAPNMLSRRLAAMVESNLLEKRQYCERPPRYEYVPTQRGRDFQPVLWALLAWGNKHCTEAGKGIHIVNMKTGAVADPVLVDRKSGKLLSDQEFHLVCEAKAAQAALVQRALVQRALVQRARPIVNRVSLRRESRPPPRRRNPLFRNDGQRSDPKNAAEAGDKSKWLGDCVSLFHARRIAMARRNLGSRPLRRRFRH